VAFVYYDNNRKIYGHSRLNRVGEPMNEYDVKNSKIGKLLDMKL